MKRIFSLLVIIAFMNVLVIGPVNANTEAAEENAVAEETQKAEAAGDNNVEEAPKAEAAKITLSVSIPSVYLKQKATVQAKISIVGEASDKVVWKSGNENVATVDQNGKITANAKNSGKVVITATVGDVSASKTIFVWNAKLKGGNYYTYPNSSVKSSQKGTIAYGKDKVMYFSLEKSKKGTYKIIDYVGGKTANSKNIKGRYFSSSALKSKYWAVAYIPTEQVAATKPSTEGSENNTIDAEKITLNMSLPSAYLKQKGEMQAKVEIKGNAQGDVQWKSGNEKIAVVDQNGKITADAKNSGRVKITATVGEVSASKEIFVWNAKLKGGNFYTYPNASTKATQRGIIAYGKEKAMYFSLEKNKNGAYKIIDYIGGKTENNKNIKGRYFSSSSLKSKYWEKVNEDTTITDITGLNCENAVKNLVELKVMSMSKDGKFEPKKSITKAEMAVILCKMVGIDNITVNENANVPSKFSDVAAGEWYTGYINVAVGKGLLNGFPDGTFGPNEQLTMNQVLILCVNALGRGEYVAEKGTYPDNYITEATKLGLLDGVKTYDANRGNVAIIVWNTLKAPYVWDVTDTEFEGTNNMGNTGRSLLNIYFKGFIEK